MNLIISPRISRIKFLVAIRTVSLSTNYTLTYSSGFQTNNNQITLIRQSRLTNYTNFQLSLNNYGFKKNSKEEVVVVESYWSPSQ